MSINAAVSGSTLTITFDRPDALNALTPAMLVELGDHLESAASSSDVSVVVLTGNGRAFSAGVDLKALAEMGVKAGDVSPALNDPARRATDLLSTIPKVTIAKVNGFCFTGALELALACDLMVTANEAKMGDTHAKFGLRPTWGMSARLIRAVGPTRARELSYTARTFSGAEAAEFGMAIRSVPLADLDGVVDELVEQITANAPESLSAYKDLYRSQQNVGITAGLEFEYSTDYQMGDAAARVGAFGSS